MGLAAAPDDGPAVADGDMTEKKEKTRGNTARIWEHGKEDDYCCGRCVCVCVVLIVVVVSSRATSPPLVVASSVGTVQVPLQDGLTDHDVNDVTGSISFLPFQLRIVVHVIYNPD